MMLNFYLETKYERFKTYVYDLKKKLDPESETAYILKLNLLISMLDEQHRGKKEEKKVEEEKKEETSPNKNQAKEKKEKLMKKLK